jgi:hypothetical protein
MISDVDMTASAFRVQFIAGEQSPEDDSPAGVPPVSSLSTDGVSGAVLLTMGLPDFELFDSAEIYASSTNDRTASTKVGEAKATTFMHPLASSTTRYYWARCRRGAVSSEWFPVSATAGVSGTAA